MNEIILVVLALAFAFITSFIITYAALVTFCEGYASESFCSLHDGGILVVAGATFGLSFYIYTYFLLSKR